MPLNDLQILDASQPIVELNLTMSEPFQLWMFLIVEYNKRFGGSNTHNDVVLLGDDEEISLDAGLGGYGSCQIGDNQEFAYFSFTSAGVVTLIMNSGNVVSTDTDTKLCIYAGTKVNIKNRLGSSLSLRYSVKYNPV